MKFSAPALDSSKHTTKEFCGPFVKERVDEVIAWLEEENDTQRVAILRTPSHEHPYAMMPAALYERLDNLANAASYLPHWELDGILPEDLPVIRDVIVAANDELLIECVREVLKEAIYPNENPNLVGACDYIRRMTSVVRSFDFNPCNSVIMLPYCRYRAGAEGVIREMQTISLSFSNARIGRIEWAQSGRIGWWHHTLGLKAWFGGVSTRDEYRALAWLLCTMQADGLVDYGIWMGGRPQREYSHPSVRELNMRADDDLRQRARDAMGRLREPNDMTTLSFECGREEYDMLVAVCNQYGLSIQNAVHIALRRLIAYCESTCGALDTGSRLSNAGIRGFAEEGEGGDGQRDWNATSVEEE